MSTEAPRNPEDPTEEELWASLEGQVGSERVSTLIDLVSIMLDRAENESALSLADSALETALEGEQDQVLARAYFVRGIVLSQLDRDQEAADEFLKSAALYERFDSYEATIDAYIRASWALEVLEEYEAALSAVDSAILVAQTAEDSIWLGRGYRQRADCLKGLGRESSEVLQALATARQAFRSSPNPLDVVRVDDAAATVFQMDGDFKAALNLYRDCLSVCQTIQPERVPYFTYFVGRSLRCLGEMDEALDHLRRAEASYTALGDASWLADILYEIAICLWRLDQDDEALATLSRARANADAVGRDYLLAEIDATHASWLHGLRRYRDAVDINRRLIETEIGEARFVSRARLADNYLAWGDMESALIHCQPEAGDEEFVGTGNWFWREVIRARVHEQNGDRTEAWAIARACLQLDLSVTAASTKGKLHELMGDYHAHGLNDQEGAQDWYAKAVALYLAANWVSDAKRLSRGFLPSSAVEQVQ